MKDYVICKYDPTQEDKYGWAACKCLSLNCGIRVKRRKENDYFSLKCPNCGEQIGITLRGTDSNCSYINIS